MPKTVGQMIIGVIQWTIAIVSVVAAVGLFTWLAFMLFKKDNR